MVVLGADTFAATERESGILPVWNAEEAAISEVGFILLRDKPVQESEEESLPCFSFQAGSRKNHPE